jgi:hypothetical protein
VLERRLNGEMGAARWEIVNTAVPGYNPVMEVATLRETPCATPPTWC